MSEIKISGAAPIYQSYKGTKNVQTVHYENMHYLQAAKNRTSKIHLIVHRVKSVLPKMTNLRMTKSLSTSWHTVWRPEDNIGDETITDSQSWTS